MGKRKKTAVAKHKEIETKWEADEVSRQQFLTKIKRHIKVNKFKYRYLFAGGYDYYYSNKEGRAPRHRIGSTTNELTVKARLTDKSITVRKEVNIPLAADATPFDVLAFFELIGFKRVLPIYKTCDIFFIKDGKASVDVVWYKVTHAHKAPDFYVEVEIGGLNTRKSKKLLKRWKKVMFDLYGLTDNDISPDSLYEIYSGKKYRKD